MWRVPDRLCIVLAVILLAVRTAIAGVEKPALEVVAEFAGRQATGESTSIRLRIINALLRPIPDPVHEPEIPLDLVDFDRDPCLRGDHRCLLLSRPQSFGALGHPPI